MDHEGEILESFVTKKRDKAAAFAVLKKVLKRHGRAEAIVTDGMRSYTAAMRELGNLERREIGSWLNSRAENSHLPFRRRERAMQRFWRMKSLQKFASVHASFHNQFASRPYGSNRTVILSTDRPTRFAARLPWPSGRTSRPNCCAIQGRTPSIGDQLRLD